jgi:hypothetical protein
MSCSARLHQHRYPLRRLQQHLKTLSRHPRPFLRRHSLHPQYLTATPPLSTPPTAPSMQSTTSQPSSLALVSASASRIGAIASNANPAPSSHNYTSAPPSPHIPPPHRKTFHTKPQFNKTHTTCRSGHQCPPHHRASLRMHMAYPQRRQQRILHKRIPFPRAHTMAASSLRLQRRARTGPRRRRSQCRICRSRLAGE